MCGEWFILGVPGKWHDLHTRLILDVIDRKSDNQSTPILSSTNTYYLNLCIVFAKKNLSGMVLAKYQCFSYWNLAIFMITKVRGLSEDNFLSLLINNLGKLMPT